MSSSSSTQEIPARRGLPRWLKVLIIVFLVIVNIAVIGLIWAINTGQNLLSGAATDDEVVSALQAPSGDSLTFLVLGSDSREGLDDLTNFGSAGGERGDVIMLVRVDPDEGAQILSIPRDLWVDIPGHGKNKINAAYAFGGPSLMVNTIHQNLGIPINHYVEIGFVGFEGLVNEIGGIEIPFPYPARDVKSGLDVDAGTQRLDGAEALAYARSRTYQEFQGGRWVSVDANDIGRTGRQQEVVNAILRELKSPSSIGEAGGIVEALAEHMTIDANLAKSSVANLFWDFRGILTSGADGMTLPVDLASINGQSVVLAREPEASAAIADFLAGSPTIEAPLRIEVLNGNGVGGAATRMAQDLEAAGFSVALIGDAARNDYETTIVVVPAGRDADGDMVVRALGVGVVTVGQVGAGHDVTVIVGRDVS